MAARPNPLGEFLRARRELVTPEQAGLAAIGVRRVPGLRREEVALLAGISSDYYLRLEQGRYRNPSVQVLEAVARVLRLDDESVAHLLGLAADKPHVSKRRARRETVPASLASFVHHLGLPAFVEGRYLDVLAANPLATAVSPRLAVGGNRLRDFFLDPDERDLFVEWERAGEGLVASFRSTVGTETDDVRFVELVGQLSLASPQFRRLWARHDIGGRHGGLVRLDHPVVGELVLYREKLIVGEMQNLTVAIYHPEPASEAAEKLALLAAAVDPGLPTRRQPARPSPRTDGPTDGARTAQ